MSLVNGIALLLLSLFGLTGSSLPGVAPSPGKTYDLTSKFGMELKGAIQILKSHQDAEKFARGLLEAVQLIKDSHFSPAPEAQLLRWAIQGLYQDLKEPLPPGLADRLKGLEKANPKEVNRSLYDARVRLGEHPALDDGRDLQLSLTAIFARLEPAAAPKDRSAYTPPQDIICGHLLEGSHGVGLRLKTDSATGMLQVVTPVYQGPAYKAGIRAGDLITHIRIDKDRKNEPLASPLLYLTKGMPLDQAVELILGREGTSLTLIVIPAGSNKAGNKDMDNK